jgi:transketolase
MTFFKEIKEIDHLQRTANLVRQDIIRMLAEAGSGHSAGPMGMADIFTALYFNTMNHNPEDPTWQDRDRFILSNGHICPVWYAVLARVGYFPLEELMTLRKLGTRLHSHPQIHAAPGIENSAGTPGQGIPIAAGLAMAAKMDKKDFTVYCSMDDGELNEGQTWEAFNFAAAHNLNNLIVVVGRNYIQIHGNSEDSMPMESLTSKFRAFGWNAFVIDGNDMKQIIATFHEVKKTIHSPNVIIANTIPGKGVSFMEHKYEWYGKPPTPKQAKLAITELCNEHCELQGKACYHC